MLRFLLRFVLNRLISIWITTSKLLTNKKNLDLEVETSNFFNNIGVNQDVAYTLSRRLQIRNTETHYALGNKQMKNVDYVVNQLTLLSKDIEKVSENSSFANEKGDIVKLLNDFQKVYVALASPVA